MVQNFSAKKPNVFKKPRKNISEVSINFNGGKIIDKFLLKWINENIGYIIESPRTKVFKRQTKNFEILGLQDDRIYIRLNENKNSTFPLSFLMFDRVLDYLRKNKGKPIRLGAKISPPYETASLEREIWRYPYPIKNYPYRASPHICDILVLVGLVKYISIVNPKTKRKIQCVTLI